MKARLLIVLAAIAMLFTACGKDEDTDVQLKNNTMVYDGVTYQLHSSAILEGDGPYLSFFAESNDDVQFQGHLDGLNKTFDLTQAQDFMFDQYMYINQTPINIAMYGDGMAGTIGETVYGGESIFNSGTFKNTYNDNGVTCELNGILKNGKTLAYKIFVPKNEIQMPPHK